MKKLLLLLPLLLILSGCGKIESVEDKIKLAHFNGYTSSQCQHAFIQDFSDQVAGKYIRCIGDIQIGVNDNGKLYNCWCGAYNMKDYVLAWEKANTKGGGYLKEESKPIFDQYFNIKK